MGNTRRSGHNSEGSKLKLIYPGAKLHFNNYVLQLLVDKKSLMGEVFWYDEDPPPAEILQEGITMRINLFVVIDETTGGPKWHFRIRRQ